MADKIKIRRGLFQNLPDLDEGELGYSTDTRTLYLGTSGTDNILVNPIQYVESEDAYYIDGYLIPSVDNVHDLGTAELRWRSVAVGPGTLSIISKDTDEGHSENKEFNIGINPDTGTLQFTSDDNVLMELDSTGTASIPGLSIPDLSEITQTEDGYIGIGTTTPINKLEVKGSVVIGTGLEPTAQAPSDGLRVQGDLRLDGMQQFLSVYRTTSSLSITTAFNAFGTNNGGLITVLSSRGITFNTSTGVATIARTGIYYISANLYLLHSTDNILDGISITVDGATVWQARPFLRGSTTPVDPQGFSGSIIYGLDAGDTVECMVNSSSGFTLDAEEGCTFNIMRIA